MGAGVSAQRLDFIVVVEGVSWTPIPDKVTGVSSHLDEDLIAGVEITLPDAKIGSVAFEMTTGVSSHLFLLLPLLDRKYFIQL